jgi:aryl-alcohol dehydrogenase-like predicted oxidoreductase
MSTEAMRDFIPDQEPIQWVLATLKSVAEETGRSMPQVALAWLRHRPVPVIPILGARKLSQLQDNLANLELTLSAEQVKSLLQKRACSSRPTFAVSAQVAAHAYRGPVV